MKKEKLYEIIKLAQEYYQDSLYSENGTIAMKYLKEREITETVINKFSIGYAPDNDELLSCLSEQGFNEEEILLSGLAVKKGSRIMKKFNNRIMIPIYDTDNKIVSFCGRTLASNEAVFLNSADTPIFTKEDCLFGLNITNESTEPYILLVEGVLDVVTFNQKGNTSVVATIGIELSKKQVKMLKSLNKEILIAYDNDELGMSLANKAFETLKQEGVIAKIVSRNEWLQR